MNAVMAEEVKQLAAVDSEPKAAGPSDSNTADVQGLLAGAMYELEVCMEHFAHGAAQIGEDELVARMWAAHYMVQRARSGAMPDNYQQVLGVAAAYDALDAAYDDLLQADFSAELAKSEGVGIEVDAETRPA